MLLLHAPREGKTVEEGWTMKGVSNWLEKKYGENKTKIFFYQADYRKLDEKYKRKNTGGKNEVHFSGGLDFLDPLYGVW